MHRPSDDQMRHINSGQNITKVAKGTAQGGNQLVMISVTENDLRRRVFLVTGIFIANNHIFCS